MDEREELIEIAARVFASRIGVRCPTYNEHGTCAACNGSAEVEAVRVIDAIEASGYFIGRLEQVEPLEPDDATPTSTLMFALVVPGMEGGDLDDDLAESMADEFAFIINEERARNSGCAGPVMVSGIPGAQWLTRHTLSRFRRVDAFMDGHRVFFAQPSLTADANDTSPAVVSGDENSGECEVCEGSGIGYAIDAPPPDCYSCLGSGRVPAGEVGDATP